MSDERTVPPSALRIRRAKAAGWRPRGALVGRGCVLLGVAWGLDSGLAAAHRWRPGPIDDLGQVMGLLQAGLEASVWVLGGGIVAILLGGVWHGWAPRREDAIRSLAPVPTGRSWPRRAVWTVGALASVLVLGRGVLAGAARAPQASAHALLQMWEIWFVRSLAVAGLVCLGWGAVEAGLAYRRFLRSLYQRPQDVAARRGTRT